MTKRYWFAPDRVGGPWWHLTSPISVQGKILEYAFVGWMLLAIFVFRRMLGLSTIELIGLLIAGAAPFAIILRLKTDPRRSWKDYEKERQL
ncbi:MAG: hypothetical protein RIE56_07340 [Amphiplicatus sp.]